MRAEIISLGGEFRFLLVRPDLIIEQGKLEAIVVNEKEKIAVSDLILATGHSARDVYQLLFDRQLELAAKPFSMGVRIEHKAEMINRFPIRPRFSERKTWSRRSTN